MNNLKLYTKLKDIKYVCWEWVTKCTIEWSKRKIKKRDTADILCESVIQDFDPMSSLKLHKFTGNLYFPWLGYEHHKPLKLSGYHSVIQLKTCDSLYCLDVFSNNSETKRKCRVCSYESEKVKSERFVWVYGVHLILVLELEF